MGRVAITAERVFAIPLPSPSEISRRVSRPARPFKRRGARMDAVAVVSVDVV